MRRPPSFLRAQQTARNGEAGAPKSAAIDPARATLEERYRRGELTAAELAREKSALAERAAAPAGMLGSESVRELGASVLLVGLLVVVLMATGRWDPVAPPPGPPVAELPGSAGTGEVPGDASEGTKTRAAGAQIEPPAELPPPAEPRPAPALASPNLTLGGGRAPLRGIAFEVASSSYPDSAALALRRIMRGSKLPCRIVTKSSGDTYRVVVGPFQTRREAERAITELFRSALVERARIVQLVE